MKIKSMRWAFVALLAAASPALWAAPSVQADDAVENVGAGRNVVAGRAAADPAPSAIEVRAETSEEIVLRGVRMEHDPDLARLKADLREQTIVLTARLRAAIRHDLKLLAAPKLAIGIASAEAAAAADTAAGGETRVEPSGRAG